MSNNGHLTQCSWIKSRKSMDKISSCRPLLDMSANDNCRALYIIVCSSICFKVTFFVLVLVQNYRSHWNLLKTLSAHRLELDFWEFHIFFHDHPIFFMTFSWPQKNFNFHDFLGQWLPWKTLAFAFPRIALDDSPESSECCSRN